jgi:hypothetical protein
VRELVTRLLLRSSPAGAVTGGTGTRDVRATAAFRAVDRVKRVPGRTSVESSGVGRTALCDRRTEVTGVAAWVRESLTTAGRDTAFGAGAGDIMAVRESPPPARWLAVQPTATAATMLAAQDTR